MTLHSEHYFEGLFPYLQAMEDGLKSRTFLHDNSSIDSADFIKQAHSIREYCAKIEQEIDDDISSVNELLEEPEELEQRVDELLEDYERYLKAFHHEIDSYELFLQHAQRALVDEATRHAVMDASLICKHSLEKLARICAKAHLALIDLESNCLQVKSPRTEYDDADALFAALRRDSQ